MRGPSLTAKERREKVLAFILRYQAEHDGEPPSQKTVYLALGLRSWQVSRYIRKLERVGALKRPGYEAPKAKAFGA
jgi:Mn-dependent DtxR family transcriptional regulator